MEFKILPPDRTSCTDNIASKLVKIGRVRTCKFSDVAKLSAALGEHFAANLQDRKLSVWQACVRTK